MLKVSQTCFRYRTAWRELLHPLPVKARHAQWLKRDTVEMNEAILRQPYYTIKGMSQPSYMDKTAAFGSVAVGGGGVSPTDVDSPQSSHYVMNQQLKHARRAASPERLAELRAQLQFPSTVGPMLAGEQFKKEYGDRLRPRYPQSWDTVPPHQPSRN